MTDTKLSDKKLHLKITTHERVVFDSDVDEIYCKGTQGEFGILSNHVPFMSPLEIGLAKIIVDGKPELFTIMGGIFQLKDNQALILTQIAERAEEIDVERAKEAQRRAKERLEAGAEDDMDVKRAEIALVRSITRLKAAGK